MKKIPFISIIMPAYNAEKFIAKSIDSVLSQTYKNFELIIIDDFSTDNTNDIIKKYQEKHEKYIRIYTNKKNMGVSKTRNKAILLSKYDWIAFLDSDDIWDNSKLKKQVEILSNNDNAKIIYTGSSFIDENDVPYNYIFKIPTTVNYKMLLKQNVISCSSTLVKKDLLLKYNMAGDFMHEDYAVWLRILKNDVKEAIGIDEPLLIYRISTTSKSSNKIKAAKMNYNTYKFIKLNFFQRIYYMSIYTIKSLIKYNNIKKGG